MFLFSILIGQDNGVVPCIHFCDSMNDEGVTLLLYSVVVLQGLAVFQPDGQDYVTEELETAKAVLIQSFK